MIDSPDGRQLVVRARSQLEEWTRRARTTAYAELFEGEDSILSAADVRTLDALDSELERRGGDGVWGTDQYGIHAAGGSESRPEMDVVCVYHPQVTSDTVLRGVDDVDDETEVRLNDALWRYAERVAELVDDELDAFLREVRE